MEFDKKIMEKFRELVRKEKKEGFIRLRLPKHIAVVTAGKGVWARKHKIPKEEAYEKSYTIIRSTMLSAIRLDIPIVTFYLLSTDMKDLEQFSILMDSLKDFFEDLSQREFVHKKQVKISVFGKWYDLPGRVVDSIKKSVEVTKDYDNFFMNFCINYSGQEEIVDAVKLIARQIKADKLDVEAVNKELIKENVYSSYFLPPDLIIVNGPVKATGGLMLWDSPKSQIYFTSKLWPDFDKTEFMDAIKEYQKGK
ncbi:MAG: polyprenyl diphosphate synthase [Nanoarchaeota archaeon]